MPIGPSTSQTPYIVATAPNVEFTSILSVGDQIGLKDGPLAGQPWRMVGIPDGLGAFDNGDGTMTVLMNHELAPTVGVVREHGATGAFVSKLTVDSSTFEVIEAGDLVQQVYLYNDATNTYDLTTTQFARLCSADLPDVSAFYDANSGLGTMDRIFMNGEEFGNTGRAFAHVVTGDEAGISYELAWLGQMAWENTVANPGSGAKTVVAAFDDSTPGEVYIYVGDKQSTGLAIQNAGLEGGDLYGIVASFGDDPTATPADGTFTLALQGTDGDVSELSGTAMNTAAGPLTQFGRPEDGQWDPTNPNRLYFVTTGNNAGAVPAHPTRLWALDFEDVEHPELGGTIKVLVEGVFPNSPSFSDAGFMWDNMTVTESGLVFLQEDPGANDRLSRVWMYDPTKDNGVDQNSGLTMLGEHDPARFAAGLNPIAPGGFFDRDDESSGIIEVTDIVGGNKLSFLLDTQAHYAIDTDPVTAGVQGEYVEGGQLMLMTVDLPNPGNDRFIGRGSTADVYDGGFGDDFVFGDNGNDKLSGNYGNDRIYGDSGDDTLLGGVGADILSGGDGLDTIDGGTGNDRLSGDSGADTIHGGVGNDILLGGDGADTLAGGFGNDRVMGGDGNDTMQGNQGNDVLRGEDGDDTIDGGSGDDFVDGQAGANTLMGGEGDDLVRGGADDDVLQGGQGADILAGGEGSDTFFFGAGDGNDSIKGFRPVDDTLQFDFGVVADDVTFVGFAETQIGDTAAVLTYNKPTGELFWDATGGAPDDQILLATITNKPVLHIADCLFGSL